MLLTKSKFLLLAGVAAISLSLAGCDDAKNDTPGTNNGSGTSSANTANNCPAVPNSDQKDTDGDGLGDVCDNDIDGDGKLNTADNCQLVPNFDQADSDADGRGDACIDDKDGDGIKDEADNCPTKANNPNTNSDADPRGDACQDKDIDGIIDLADNCPGAPNSDQKDTDGDKVGDDCDSDSDNDTVPDGVDNCRFPNKDQADINKNGIGDACETGTLDTDGDTIADTTDNCRTKKNADQKDTNSNGLGDVCDDSDRDGKFDADDRCPNDKDTGFDTDINGVDDACDPNIDGDAFTNSTDNCPLVANAAVGGKQPDADNDGVGDACDDDTDGDGIKNGTDRCPTTSSSNNNDRDNNGIGDVCEDSDKDGFKDAFDNCPTTATTLPEKDTDGDGLGDICDDNIDGDAVADDLRVPTTDNCPYHKNDNQADFDKNGVGDACDLDRDGDKNPNTADNCPLVPNPDKVDSDNDGMGDACDTNGYTCGAGTATPDCPTSTQLKTSYTCSSFAPPVKSIKPVKEGGLCALSNVLLNGSVLDICGVDSPSSAADGNGETFAKVNNAVALADSLFTNGALTGNVGIEVEFKDEVPAGNLAAFKISVPRSLVELSLAKAITVTTEAGDTFGGPDQSGGFALELLTAGYDGNVDPLGVSTPTNTQPKYVLGGYATKPFKVLTIKVGGGLSADLGTSLEVYDVCTGITVSSTPVVGDGSSPIPVPGAGGIPGGENPLGVITTPLGNALAPVTGALGAVTTPLSDALNGALGSTPLAPVSNALVDLLDGTGEPGEPNEPPAIPTSLDDLIALFPENPLTGPLSDALETLMGFIPGGGGETPPPGETNSPLFPLTGPLGAVLDPLTAALDPLANPLTDALRGALGATPLSPVSQAVEELLNGGDPEANPFPELPAPFNNLGNPQEALNQLTNLLNGGPNDESPLALITVPAGEALAVVTGPLGVAIGPLTSTLDGSIGQTPLRPVTQALNELLNATPGDGGAGGFPTTPAAFQELLTNNPLTGLLAGGAESFPTTPEAFQELLTNNPLTQALTGAAANFPFNPFG